MEERVKQIITEEDFKQMQEELAKQIEEYQKLFDSAPEEAKEVLAKIDEEIKDGIESVMTRMSLVAGVETAAPMVQLLDSFRQISVQVHEKYWPQIVDMIKNNEEAAEFFKKIPVVVSSPTGAFIYVVSQLAPHIAAFTIQAFLTGGTISALTLMAELAQPITNPTKETQH